MSRTTTPPTIIALLVASALAAGCAANARSAGGPAPAAAVSAAAADAARAPADDFVVSGTTGTIEEVDIENAFRTRRRAIDACYADVAATDAWLGGTLALKVRVDAAGAVQQALVERPLGHLAVEQCIVGVVRGMRFPAPSGGSDAEFGYTLAFQGRMTLAAWGPAEVGRVIAAHRGALAACSSRSRNEPRPPSLRIAFFVGPGGSARSVGVGADAPVDEAYAGCVAALVRTWRFQDPRGRMARAEIAF